MIELPMAQRRDGGALLRSLLLVAIAAFLVFLIRSGQIQYYIHPRFIWFTWVAAGGICLMAFGQVRRFRLVKGEVHPPVALGLYGSLALVVLVGVAVPPHRFGADLAQKQGINLTNRTMALGASGGSSVGSGSVASAGAGPSSGTSVSVAAGAGSGTGTSVSAGPGVGVGGGSGGGSDSGAAANSGAGSNSGAAANSGAGANAAAGATPSPGANPAGSSSGAGPSLAAPATGGPKSKQPLQIEGDRIIVTPRNFMRSMIELYENSDRYVGMKIAYDGFVLYPTENVSADWTLARLIVTCHVAHAYPDGLLIAKEGLTERPNQDSWFRVEGVLEPYTFEGTPTIRVRATSLQSIAAPSDPYIYP